MDSQSDRTGTVIGLRATFDNSEQMQAAVEQLLISGFDRADLTLVSPERMQGETTPDAGSKPAFTESDARQARTLGASTAGTAAALAAAGVTIATGGAAAPAVAAAVVAGGAIGGSMFAIAGAVGSSEQSERDQRAMRGALALSVRAADELKRSKAEAILLAAGASDVELLR